MPRQPRAADIEAAAAWEPELELVVAREQGSEQRLPRREECIAVELSWPQLSKTATDRADATDDCLGILNSLSS